jgi:hypothetical protein
VDIGIRMACRWDGVGFVSACSNDLGTTRCAELRFVDLKREVGALAADVEPGTGYYMSTRDDVSEYFSDSAIVLKLLEALQRSIEVVLVIHCYVFLAILYHFIERRR